MTIFLGATKISITLNPFILKAYRLVDSFPMRNFVVIVEAPRIHFPVYRIFYQWANHIQEAIHRNPI